MSGMAKRANGKSGPELLMSWRHRRDVTQETLARRVGVAQGTLCSWERGSRRPRIQLALKLEEITGIPVRAWAA
jgi:DNA-binding XRE family transcriptional regulator